MVRSLAMVNIDTLIYVFNLLRTVLKATKCQLHTAVQNTCLQIFYDRSTNIPVRKFT